MCVPGVYACERKLGVKGKREYLLLKAEYRHTLMTVYLMFLVIQDSNTV